MPRKVVTLIFHTTSSCNLSCSYCYCQMNKDIAVKLSLHTFRECVQKADNFFGPEYEICFLFHGGEPLLLGKSFYKDAFRFLKERMTRKYYTGIQTNLILLDEDFVELFRENNCSISTSLDGYHPFNDLYRRYHNGQGTYVDVNKNIQLLREREVQYGIVSVINHHNVTKPEEFYCFMKEHPNVLFGLSPMFLTKEENIVATDPNDLGMFLIALFDLWIADSAPPRIIFFDEIIRSYIEGNASTVCTFHHDCTEVFFTIDGQGNVYPCCHFVGREQLCYGNLLRSSFSDVYNSDIRLYLSNRAVRSDNPCRACEFFQMCFSGCMATSRNGITSKDFFCNAYKMIFSHVKKYLERSLEMIP